MKSQPRPTGLGHLRFWRTRLPGATFVYVIQGEPGTPIKVGIAKDPRTRLRSLQTGNPQKLHLLYVVPGDTRLEAAFHRRLREANLLGEWFGGEIAEEFVSWMHDYAERAIEVFNETRRLPGAPPLPKRVNRAGLSAGAWSGKAARWRTSDAQEHEVTVRFEPPSPRSAPDETAQKLAAAAKAGFSGYELEMFERELRARAA